MSDAFSLPRFSRRLALVGAPLTLASVTGCIRKPGRTPPKAPSQTKEVPPAVPFGARPHPFADGAIFPSASEESRDQAVKDFYAHWKQTYLVPGCDEGQLVVRSKTKPSNLTVSEAHGYGMIILAYMAGHDPNAKTQFDAMVRYHRAHQSGITKGIMAWNQNTGCADVGGKNGAADGDLDIAYGLLLADKQWGSCHDVNYRMTAEWVIAAISKSSLDYEGRYPLLGDWVNPSWTLSHYNGTRVSDFMGTHFRAFSSVSPDTVWPGLLDNVYWIAEVLQDQTTTGLLPDFAEGLDVGQPRPASMGYLEGARDGSYAYNACRIPLRMGTDFLLNEDPRPRRIAARINEFAKTASGGDPTKLRGGYHLDGTEMVDYETMAFTAPFTVGAMVDPNGQEWLDRLWTHCVERDSENYYEDTLRLLSMIAISGNWWAPEKLASPCPDETE